MTQNMTLTTTTTDTRNLDTLARRAPATDDLLQLNDWLSTHGPAHLNAIARIELAEQMITRRRFLIGAGTLGLGMITGCGAEEAKAPTATSTSTGYPRTVEHAGGTTTIETKPTTILVMRTFYELDALLFLGIIPALIGSFPGRRFYPWQIDAGADEATVMDMSNGPNLEQAVAAGVDFAIANETFFNGAQEQIEAMSSVAPVVALPDLDFEEQLRIVRDCLDLSEATIAQKTDEIESLLADARFVQPPSSVSAISVFSPPQVSVWTSQSSASLLMERVGLPSLSSSPVPEQQVDGNTVDISLEVLPEIDSTVLIGISQDDPETQDALEAEPLFQQIPAVQARQYYRLNPDDSWALRSPSALNLPVALETLQRIFSE
ncbi:MAG: hypothetical protein AAGF95_01660 [Chloroflexota bacterium]